MPSDPLATATDRITGLIIRKKNPLSTLEAVCTVTEAMSDEDAKTILARLIGQRYLCQLDGDIAQMLAARLGVEVQWSHARLVMGSGEWREGRGQNV